MFTTLSSTVLKSHQGCISSFKNSKSRTEFKDFNWNENGAQDCLIIFLHSSKYILPVQTHCFMYIQHIRNVNRFRCQRNRLLVAGELNSAHGHLHHDSDQTHLKQLIKVFKDLCRKEC